MHNALVTMRAKVNRESECKMSSQRPEELNGLAHCATWPLGITSS